MLKDWGTQKQRLGKDSHKSFELCILWLSRVNDPTWWEKGHLFCKECIIENLVQQKKEKQQEIDNWERSQHEKVLLDERNKQQELADKIQKFEKLETQPKGDRLDREQIELEEMNEEDRAKAIVAKSRLNKEFNKEERKEWIKTSFWANDPSTSVKKKEKEKPVNRLICPSHESQDHFIKMKNLVNLTLTPVEDGKEFMCPICK